MSILPLTEQNLIESAGPSDSSAVVTQARMAVLLTHRLYCKRHAPDVSSVDADSKASEAFDTVMRRERHHPAYMSQVGLDGIVTHVIQKLGVTGDRDLTADLNAHLSQLVSSLPHHLTVV